MKRFATTVRGLAPRILAAALMAGGLSAVLAAPAQAQRNGTYEVAGTNPDGSSYSGNILIQQVGLASWRVRWTIGQAQIEGYGMSVGRVFSIGFVLGERPGMSIFEVAEDGSMSGQWTLIGSSAIGTENLTPR
ncbi:hypothetical protein [Muricoccus vinaceus]|uniref:Fibronectin-binding protein n=1 Tax=Muricoccus vinaceus TaxID=424704 RepID=A0ABV6ILQ0_9PROT